MRWVEGSNAGFFLWADFRALLGGDIVVADEGKEKEEEEEEVVEAVAVGRPSQVYRTSRKAKARDDWFFEKMIKAKVFVASGNAFFAEEHGWFVLSLSLSLSLSLFRDSPNTIGLGSGECANAKGNSATLGIGLVFRCRRRFWSWGWRD